MTLFSKKITGKNKDVKFAGVNFPLLLNSYLTLYTIATSTSKSALICNQMEEWKENQMEIMPLEELIELVVEKALEACPKKEVRIDGALKHFLNRLKKELVKKGIEKDIVSEILKKVTHEANQ